MIIIDDSLLLAVIGGVAIGELAEAFSALELATTSSWYFRLGRAIRDPRSDGTHSRALARLSDAGRTKVHAALETPPTEIAIAPARPSIPLMIAVGTGRRMNFLTAEALAAALVFDADIYVATLSPLLQDAANDLDIRVHLMTP